MLMTSTFLLKIATIVAEPVKFQGTNGWGVSKLGATKAEPVIATTKAMIVANHFMHLKYENKLLKWLFGVTMLLFTVFIALTAIDYITR